MVKRCNRNPSNHWLRTAGAYEVGSNRRNTHVHISMVSTSVSNDSRPTVFMPSVPTFAQLTTRSANNQRLCPSRENSEVNSERNGRDRRCSFAPPCKCEHARRGRNILLQIFSKAAHRCAMAREKRSLLVVKISAVRAWPGSLLCELDRVLSGRQIVTAARVYESVPARLCARV
jgi:hypothetical protein